MHAFDTPFDFVTFVEIQVIRFNFAKVGTLPFRASNVTPSPQPLSGTILHRFRRWKRDPEYAAWKSTEQLVGRRVAKVPGFEGQFAALRRGWVVCKESSPSGGFEQMFRVVFPKVGSFPAEKQVCPTA